MNSKKLLGLCITAFLLNSALRASSATDHFQTFISGNWHATVTWQSSPDGAAGTWSPSSLIPDERAASIRVRSGMRVALTQAAQASLLIIEAGAVFIHFNIGTLTIYDGTSTTDLMIAGTYELYGAVPYYSGSAPSVVVLNGGEVVVFDNGAPVQSAGFAADIHVSFATGAVFRWATTTAFPTEMVTYFPNAGPFDRAIFRISANVGTVGVIAPMTIAPMTINGKFEVTAGYTIAFENPGAKIFRDGIGGDGTIVHAGVGNCGVFQITGSAASIDGTITIILDHTGGTALEIIPGATITISGTPTVLIGTASYPGAVCSIAGTVVHNGGVPISIANGALLVSGVLIGTGSVVGSETATITVSAGGVINPLRLESGGTNNFLKMLMVLSGGTLVLASDCTIIGK